MKVIQVLKRLNNTELGKNTTNDTYVLVPKNLDVSDLFPAVNDSISFIYKQNGKVANIRHTIGREKRIVGLGKFYTENSVCAGDEIVFERQIVGNESQYFIDLNKKNNIIVLQKTKKGFEILNPDRKGLLRADTEVEKSGILENISIDFLLSDKKRQDSPEITDFYDVKLGDCSILNDYSVSEIVEIEINKNRARLKRLCAWKKYIFNVEEEDE